MGIFLITNCYAYRQEIMIFCARVISSCDIKVLRRVVHVWVSRRCRIFCFFVFNIRAIYVMILQINFYFIYSVAKVVHLVKKGELKKISPSRYMAGFRII